ncbi:hypothetical protein KMW28_27145 [Flammeovirga yaeyamensis]|uniref:Uncharacterized protein n=1 Tax=Flammeovirga yaeyamensis TaxID=367791 RepID=A0AAX1NBK5_9BACT|nr:hypothetical protein [Flammeovirga yaeyamensis]MBB3700043.1 hypothetical protein [Flammeovirga yaeyamensis]NMF37520.1 hypothetical protein [Flammeovirga yaeyamensis]QWG04577.1 hypothetical protein KMW28_27145 [Flammeovirga yaeyamensis]
MGNKHFVVFNTDGWHSHKSRILVGVASSVTGAIEVINKFLASSDNENIPKELSDEYLIQIHQIGQTQGFDKDFSEGEFDVISCDDKELLIRL